VRLWNTTPKRIFGFEFEKGTVWRKLYKEESCNPYASPSISAVKSRSINTYGRDEKYINSFSQKISRDETTS
jgi:hypothetical protein